MIDRCIRFYNHERIQSKTGISEANEMIDRCIRFYNHERIQSKTGMAPLTLRHSC